MIGAKPLHVRLDKIDGFIRVHNGTRYLVLLGAEKYDSIYSRIRYLIGVKSGITYVFLMAMGESRFMHTVLCLYKKHLLCIML